MANSTFSDAEALHSLAQLLRPPPPAKPAFDIIGSLPRELAVEVRPSRPFKPHATPAPTPFLSFFVAGIPASAGGVFAKGWESLSPVERAGAGRGHLDATGRASRGCIRRISYFLPQHSHLLQSKRLIFPPDNLPHPLVDASALKVAPSPHAPPRACAMTSSSGSPLSSLAAPAGAISPQQRAYRLHSPCVIICGSSTLPPFLLRSPSPPPQPLFACDKQSKRAKCCKWRLTRTRSGCARDFLPCLIRITSG